jgi:hypothetical protein
MVLGAPIFRNAKMALRLLIVGPLTNVRKHNVNNVETGFSFGMTHQKTNCTFKIFQRPNVSSTAGIG